MYLSILPSLRQGHDSLLLEFCIFLGDELVKRYHLLLLKHLYKLKLSHFTLKKSLGRTPPRSFSVFEKEITASRFGKLNFLEKCVQRERLYEFLLTVILFGQWMPSVSLQWNISGFWTCQFCCLCGNFRIPELGIVLCFERFDFTVFEVTSWFHHPRTWHFSRWRTCQFCRFWGNFTIPSSRTWHLSLFWKYQFYCSFRQLHHSIIKNLASFFVLNMLILLPFR